MAYYQSITRSNEFKVRDRKAFRRWAASRELGVREKKRNANEYFSIYTDIPDCGGWPSSAEDKGGIELTELDFAKELAVHLQDGSVAVLFDLGFETFSYVHGHTIAVNSKGETVTLHVENIFELAKGLGSEVTRINEREK